MIYDRYKDLHLEGNKVFPIKRYYKTMNMSLRHVAKHAAHLRHDGYACAGRTSGNRQQDAGTKRITTTQIYAKITNDKIGQDMAALSEKLSSVFKVAQ